MGHVIDFDTREVLSLVPHPQVVDHVGVMYEQAEALLAQFYVLRKYHGVLTPQQQSRMLLLTDHQRLMIQSLRATLNEFDVPV